MPRSGAEDRPRIEALVLGANRRSVATTGNRRPRGSQITPRSAAQSRAAVSHSVSSTGCRSKVERLMTFSTSLVAVWYSSDSSRSRVRSRNSSSSRAFSIAMTACAAKFCNSAICLRENGRTSRRYIAITPSSGSSLRSATAKKLRAPARRTSSSKRGVRRITSGSARSGIEIRFSPPSKRSKRPPGEKTAPAKLGTAERYSGGSPRDATRSSVRHCGHTRCRSSPRIGATPFRASRRKPARGRRARS